MNCYQMPEYAAFITQMRAAPDDRVAPLVCADWIEDHGKIDHATFVRGCCRMAELRGILDDCSKRDLSYSDPERSVPDHELTRLVSDLRPLIKRHCHEWTGGCIRKMENPTAYDWPLGFWRVFTLFPYKPGGDRIRDQNQHKRLASILARQPVRVVRVQFPVGSFMPPHLVLDGLARECRGVEFRHEATARFLAPDEQEVTA